MNRLFVYIVFFASLFMCFESFAQELEKRTFKVENLIRSSKSVDVVKTNDLLRSLIVNRVDTTGFINGYPFKVLASSDMPVSMINYGYNAVFWSMYTAYAKHYPYTLSPDIVWLLISQGFASHVRANHEELRDKVVDFEGKTTLVISDSGLYKSDDWKAYIANFTELVDSQTKGDIVKTLTCDFSTTTDVERVCSQATILHSMEDYFDYMVIKAICGIPEITIYGTEEDWQKVICKTKELAKYDLQWWTSELLPVLEKILETVQAESDKQIDKVFWRNMFKYHSEEVYGNPTCVDGWIVKFYPYSLGGKRMNLKTITANFFDSVAEGKVCFDINESYSTLPNELVKVPITYIDELTNKTYYYTLCAGFVGAEQDRKTLSLKPKIAWFVYEESSVDNVVVKSHYDKLSINLFANSDITLPDALFKINSIGCLSLITSLAYLEDVDSDLSANIIEKSKATIIPKSIGEIDIKELRIEAFILSGSDMSKNASDDTIKAWAKKYLPNTKVYVYNKLIYDPN